jgi:hypothetical protein
LTRKLSVSCAFSVRRFNPNNWKYAQLLANDAQRNLQKTRTKRPTTPSQLHAAQITGSDAQLSANAAQPSNDADRKGLDRRPNICWMLHCDSGRNCRRKGRYCRQRLMPICSLLLPPRQLPKQPRPLKYLFANDVQSAADTAQTIATNAQLSPTTQKSAGHRRRRKGRQSSPLPILLQTTGNDVQLSQQRPVSCRCCARITGSVTPSFRQRRLVSRRNCPSNW